MPLDDTVNSATPQPPTSPAPRNGIDKNIKISKKDKNSTKDQIIINPDIKDIVQEEHENHAVFAYGRMNPPTTGHKALVDKMHEVAKENNASHVLVASHSQDKAKNPLSGNVKIRHLKRFFPKTNIELASKEHPTFLQHAAKLHKQGATHLHMVAGSDRIEEYTKKLNQYNGEGEGKLFNFKKITVHSSGQRDPDAEGTTGMSASKMREHASKGNYEHFKQGVPSHVSDTHTKQLYHDVRKGMGLNESVDIMDIVERVVTIQQRRKRAIQMRRNKSKLTRQRNLSRGKLANEKQLTRRAYKAAKQNIRRRFAGARGVEYQTLSPSDKMAIDKRIDPNVKNIRGMVKRLMPRIRQADVKRLQAVRSHKKYIASNIPLTTDYEINISDFNKLYEATVTKAKNPIKGKEDNNITHVELHSDKMKARGLDHHFKDNYGRTSTFRHGKEHVNVYQRGYIDSSKKHVVSVRGVNGASQEAIDNVIKKLKEGANAPSDNLGNVNPGSHQANVLKLKNHIKSIQGKKPKTVYDEKTRRYKVVYETAEYHSKKASDLQSHGNTLGSSLHNRIADALKRGDLTTAKSLKSELTKFK